MERYQQLFTRLESSKEGAFVPFVTLGDPNPALSLQIIDTLIEAGADALELGIPFSDPLADGPTIQSATLRAFAAGVTPTQCFEMLAAIRQKHPTIPIGLLMYANRCSIKASMRFTSAAPKWAWIRCWSPTCRLKSPRRSAPPPRATVSHRSSSARRTPMTIYCVKSRHTAAATPTCCRAPG